MRVYELAKQLGMENRELIPELKRLGIPVASHSSALDEDSVRIVMEKVGSIINRHINGHRVDKLYLVGGTFAYPGMDKVIEEYTGVETVLPGNPLFVTPLGIAMNN